ncbi:Crp/Fnr family transcriptional regulator [Notoacmeibacter sp. MSK16QG-6]|uniref:Crp/Fnr family transcriptional regulator n=1 Tax=Notoacmeibacter sp. MSK16QG-6 TaxID=2957982 RepID=UPI00209D750A|nr:Crp/Fnr family transcriptional regulator [Notoacmeibacter sp. MSK16QG-6]MCP1198046.1 Crp/Fnr family transcriptional regulator [Notoacmeibacter sp. MSK16QG-6]
MHESMGCLAAKLSNYVHLTERDLAHLALLEREEQTFPRHHEIVANGEPLKNLYIVKEGWAYSYVDTRDGRRQIVKLHMPGDLIGFESLPSATVACSVRSASTVVLCPFLPEALQIVFSKAERLAAILFAMSCRDQEIMVSRLRAIGRMDARERLIQMLLDMINQIRLTDADIQWPLTIPLSQTEIGDYVGLTNVHVSKTLIRLEREGLIARTDGYRLEILNEAAMERIVDYENYHRALDTSWFPKY